jgi:hypothetical protein
MPQGVAEASRIFLPSILPNLAMRNTAGVTGGKPIVRSQSISGVSVINPLDAFYDIHGRQKEAQFFYSVPDTTRELFCGVRTQDHHKFSFRFLFITSDPPWLRTGAMLVLKCFSTIAFLVNWAI